MRTVLISFVTLWFAAVGLSGESIIRPRPLGFYTMDFTEDFWNSVSEDRKLKGNVHDVLAYQDFTQIVVLRCNMHIPAGNMLDRFIQDRFNKEFEFHVEALPEAATLDMRYPLLTALVETKCGDLALFNAYSQFSVLEFAGGIGVILTEQQGYPGKKQ